MTAVKLCGIGEALFDCFENRVLLGGAPLNATAVAHQLGKLWPVEVRMISRIGNDELGGQLRRELASRSLADDFIQTDPEHPTGKVLVEMQAGEPRYTILRPVAWDFLEWNEDLADLAAECEGLIFGTLAQRQAASRSTIQRFAREAKLAVRLLDVNLRQEFFNADLLEQSLKLATAVKLNEAELGVLSQLLGIGSSSREQALIERYNLEALILTQGERGTCLIASNGDRYTAPVPRFEPEENADPVGAGDACAATCLLGLASGWRHQDIVARANLLGAYVASRAGATPEIPVDKLFPSG